MKKIAFIFHSPPHSTSAGREGLDALLATSAYSDQLAVFFVGDGVLQLMTEQQPEQILSRDYIKSFKLLDLYDVEQRYVCAQSLHDWGVGTEQLIIDCSELAPSNMAELWQTFDHIITF